MDFDYEDRALIAEAQEKSFHWQRERRYYGRRANDYAELLQDKPIIHVSADTRRKWLLRCAGDETQLPRTICGLPIIYGK